MSEISTDCRSEEGITVGLIDSIISLARVLATRSKESPAIREALEDLRSDADVAALLTPGDIRRARPRPDPFRCEKCGMTKAHGRLKGLFCMACDR